MQEADDRLQPGSDLLDRPDLTVKETPSQTRPQPTATQAARSGAPGAPSDRRLLHDRKPL
jgi:hypothetical protein